MFFSDPNITAILHNNATKTGPRNKIHHLRKESSACVHGSAPDWKKQKSGKKLPPESQIDFKVTPKKTFKNPLSCRHFLQNHLRLTGQQCWQGNKKQTQGTDHQKHCLPVP